MHGHWLLWIKELMHWREKLFRSGKKEARKAFLAYVDGIMSSSYLKEEEMKVDKDCCEKCKVFSVTKPPTSTAGTDVEFSSVFDSINATPPQEDVSVPNHSAPTDYTMNRVDDISSDLEHVDETANPPTAVTVDTIFFDVDVGSDSQQKQLQNIRNTRNKHKKDEIGGKILHCRKCDNLFSTNEIVKMSLNYYKRVAEVGMQQQDTLSNDVTVQMSAMRQDIACYTYPYHRDSFAPSGDSSSFFNTLEVRSLLLRNRFDEHDFRHRPSCFKKGPECRFHLAKPSCKETTMHIEDIANDGANVTVWHRLNSEERIESTPYLIETKRLMGSQFLNTHSVEASEVFACNTNVQMGEPCHLFYATSYAFKDTQKDDSERWLRIGTQVIKRILRMRQIANQNAIMENREPDERVSDFGEGLSMLLSAMCANLSKAICSSTMAHLLIVNNDGQRFEFSHEFSNILVGQMVDVLEGRGGRFRVRTNYSKAQGTIVRWGDSSVDDYIYRHDNLDGISLYQFNAEYRKVCKSFKQMNDKGSNDNTTSNNMVIDDVMEVDGCDSDDDNDDDDCSDAEEKNEGGQKSIYEFRNDHPGREFSFIQKRSLDTIPVISLPDNGLCRIEELEFGSIDPSTSAVDKREKYALLSMLMFYPFRSLDDLKGDDGTYWTKFSSLLSHSDRDDKMNVDLMNVDNHSLYEFGIDILYNIEERQAIQSMKSASELLTKQTIYEASDSDNDNAHRNSNAEDDSDAIDFSYFDEGHDHDVNDDYGIDGLMAQRAKRSHDNIINQANVCAEHMIGARLSHQNSLIASADDTSMSGHEGDSRVTNHVTSTSSQTSFPQLITFIEGTIVGGKYNDYVTKCDATAEEDLNIEASANDGIFTENNIPTFLSVALKVAKEEGQKLDQKQYIAYEIIVSSFLLDVLEKEGLNALSSALSQLTRNQIDRLIRKLRALGGHPQLLMFFTGFAGAGKSTCVTVARRYCFEFCIVVSIPWDEDTFLFTATTGSSASLFGGSTIHDAAFLNGNERNISTALRERWKRVRILIIDEISFFTKNNVDKLDARLKNIMGVPNKAYGGISIVFSGDFHQLKPVITSLTDRVLYDMTSNGFFLGNINSAIILEESHRFDDDPEYGQVMRRFWSGQVTLADIRYINTRVVGYNGLKLPDDDIDSDTTYACPYNRQRNAISARIFKNHLENDDFPSIDTDDLPPDHTLIIEADIRSSKDKSNGATRVSSTMRDAIINTCGDADVKVNKSKKIDPSLRIYAGAHVMCNNNDLLKKYKIGNGTIARVKRVKLKTSAPDSLIWKNWEDKKVYTVSARHVEWVEIERFPDNARIRALKKSIQQLKSILSSEDGSNNLERQNELDALNRDLIVAREAQCVRIYPTKSSAAVDLSIGNSRTKMKIKNVKITQLPINMNDATTGHKLQGMSKDKLIVVSWTFISNWVYVVLSRVRTLDGLYLLEPLPEDCLDKFQVPNDLRVFERHMRELQDRVISERDRLMAELDA